jgi:hypothetical protein
MSVLYCVCCSGTKPQYSSMQQLPVRQGLSAIKRLNTNKACSLHANEGSGGTCLRAKAGVTCAWWCGR